MAIPRKATAALREALREAEAREATARERLEAATLERETLQSVIDTLTGKPAKRKSKAGASLNAAIETRVGSKRSRRNRGPIVPLAKRKLAVVAFLRQYPNQSFGPAQLANALDAPHSSIQRAVADLILSGGPVRETGTTGRGLPRVQYRPVKITAGQTETVAG